MIVFAPDPAIAVELRPSPNVNERVGVARPDILLLHYTGMPSGDVALQRLCAAGSGVSAHYVVFEDGRIVQSVPEAQRAWHAGVGSWEGATDINSRSIGIEIVNPGHEFGYVDFPGAQVHAVIALARDILRRQPILPHRVLAHSDIAPARKEDPGEKFPWGRLHAAGVGLWVEPAPLDRAGDALTIGHDGAEVAILKGALRRYGYGLDAGATFDAPTATVVRAFQRHFRPARIDGVADPSTRATLAALLQIRDRGA